MSAEQINQLLTILSVIETCLITLLIIKVGKYLTKIILWLKKKIKDN